jgi:hypothetical protein
VALYGHTGQSILGDFVWFKSVFAEAFYIKAESIPKRTNVARLTTSRTFNEWLREIGPHSKPTPISLFKILAAGNEDSSLSLVRQYFPKRTEKTILSCSTML